LNCPKIYSECSSRNDLAALRTTVEQKEATALLVASFGRPYCTTGTVRTIILYQYCTIHKIKSGDTAEVQAIVVRNKGPIGIVILTFTASLGCSNQDVVFVVSKKDQGLTSLY
jgi:hypothetical protein